MGSMLDLVMLKEPEVRAENEVGRLRRLVNAHEAFVKRIDELVDTTKTEHISEWAISLARDTLRQQQKEIHASAQQEHSD